MKKKGPKSPFSITIYHLRTDVPFTRVTLFQQHAIIYYSRVLKYN
jgi:hypothetical protein